MKRLHVARTAERKFRRIRAKRDDVYCAVWNSLEVVLSQMIKEYSATKPSFAKPVFPYTGKIMNNGNF